MISLAAPQSGQNVPSNRTSRATGSSSVPYQPRGALRLIGCVRSLAKQAVVIGMGADPEPHEPVFRFHGQGAVVGSNRADQKRPTFLKWSDGCHGSCFRRA